MKRITSCIGFAFLLIIVGCAPSGNAPKKTPITTPTPKAQFPADFKDQIVTAVKEVNDRDLLTTHGFWSVIHGILGNGKDATLRNPITNERVNALEYIQEGGEIRGFRLIPTEFGVDVQMGPKFDGQGHQDQFVAEVIQCDISPDALFKVHGKEYPFTDLVRYAKMHASVRQKPRQELSWTLVVLSEYYGTQETWTNKFGETISFEDIVRAELGASTDKAACGGTHRLFGLHWAYKVHMEKEKAEETALWKLVKEKTLRYQDLARRFQNPDGTFSTDYFVKPGNVPDVDRRIGTTGHILEWLSLSLEKE